MRTVSTNLPCKSDTHPCRNCTDLIGTRLEQSMPGCMASSGLRGGYIAAPRCYGSECMLRR